MLLPGAWNEQMPRRIPTLDSRIQNRNGPHFHIPSLQVQSIGSLLGSFGLIAGYDREAH